MSEHNKQKINPVGYLSLAVIIVTVLGGGYLMFGSGQSGKNSAQHQTTGTTAPVVNGKQVIQMTVKAVSYQPNNFTVKAGMPVQWQITSSGQPGCDSGAIVSQLLPNGSVYLNAEAGQVTMAEFTPQTPGTYRFSCPMGMVRGTIEVVN